MNQEEFDKLLRDAPEISSDDMATAEALFPGYVFYNNIPGGRHFECSSCHDEFDISSIRRTEYDYEWEAMHASHNESGLCPRCRHRVTFKNEGKVREGKQLRDSMCFAFFQPDGENRCYIQCVELWRNFRKGQRTRICRWTDSVFILYPGEPKLLYHRCENSWTLIEAHSKTENIEPFSYGYMYPRHEPYKLIGSERMDGCFLRYSCFDKAHVHTSSVCKYLFRYCTHPQYESLIKMGLWPFVDDSFYSGRDRKKVFDWSEKGKKFFKGFSNGEVKELCQMGSRGPMAVDLRVRFRKICKLSLAEAADAAEEIIYHQKLQRLLLKYRINPKKYLRWQEKQKSSPVYSYRCSCHAGYMSGAVSRSVAGDYVDYIEICEDIGRDLADETVKFPKDLSAAHDSAAETQIAIKSERKRKKMAKEDEKYKKQISERQKKYTYSDGGKYTVIFPPTLSDIIIEGDTLHHCVAGYAGRHAKGELTIVFVRLSEEPTVPLYTAEISKDGKLVQIRGDHNIQPEQDAIEFISTYLKHINKKKKEEKNGKSNDTNAA